MRSLLASLALLSACAEPAASWIDAGGDDTPAPDADPDAPDASGLPAGDPGNPGSFTITTTNATVTTSLGSAAVTVYTPGGTGPFPLVVVSTGFQIGKANYDSTSRHLASWGYVVLAHDYTSGNHQEKAGEVGELIDWALGNTAADATKIATAGHSMGGKVSILAAIEDARVKAVVGWDPVDALPPFSDGSTSVAPERIDELAVPIAVIGETTDGGGGGGGMACAPVADNYAAFFTGSCGAPDALEVTIAGADHTDWVDDRSACGLACLFCGTGATADATVLAITKRVTVAWLETHLRGRTDLGSHLTAPGVPATVREIPPGC